MNIIAENKNIKGMVFNNNVQGWSNPPKVNLIHTSKLPTRFIYEQLEDIDSTNTSAYHYTTADETKQFRLYKIQDVNTPLDYLPEYKIKFYTHKENDVSDVSLIYDGNGLFHLKGSLSRYTIYGAKIQIGETGLGIVTLEDSEGNLLLTDSDGREASHDIFSTRESGAGTEGSISNNNFTWSIVYQTQTINFASNIDSMLPLNLTNTLADAFSAPSYLPIRYFLYFNGDPTSPQNNHVVDATFL